MKSVKSEIKELRQDQLCEGQYSVEVSLFCWSLDELSLKDSIFVYSKSQLTFGIITPSAGIDTNMFVL